MFRSQKYSNPLDRISTSKGDFLFKEATIHDDGVEYFGGENLLITGDLGGGKSTLLLHIAQYARYFDDFDKKIYIKSEQAKKQMDRFPAPRPETVILRGLKYSHWTNLLPPNWDSDYPYPKKLHVYTHEDDEISFWHFRRNKKQRVLNLPPVIQYSNAAQLNLLISYNPGDIHVVFEPQKYKLDSEIVERLRARHLEAVSKKDKELSKIPVAPVVFWFEFFETMLENRPAEWLTVLFDEAHQLVPAGAKGDLWHMIGWFQLNAMIEARKNNVSVVLATQQQRQIDWRVLTPISKYIYLKGAKIPESSMITFKRLSGYLETGQGLIEQREREFGRFDFPRIKNQMPIVYAEGVEMI